MPGQVILVMIWLGLSASCIYPSILGYGLDQTGKATEAATSFVVTAGSIGIPVGAAVCSLVDTEYGPKDVFFMGVFLLVVIAGLVFVASRRRALKSC